MKHTYRLFNLGVFTLAFLGMLAGYIILPSADEIAFLNFKDKNFKTALKRYEAQYEAGGRSPTLIGPLCDLYLQYGQVNKAISVLEDNLHQLPNELEVRTRLGTYYQYAQRPTDYMLNLEAIAKIRPDLKTLRELAQIYNYTEHFEKQIQTLRLIIDQHNNSHQDYIDLAHLFAAQKRFPEAIGVVRELFSERFQEVSPEEIDFALSMLLDLGKQQEALALALRVIESKQAKYLVRISEFFTRRGATPIAFQLLKPYEKRTNLPGDILSALTSVQLAQGQEQKVMTRLTRRFKSRSLPPGVITTFLGLILEQQNGDLLHQFIAQGDLTYLGEGDILKIAKLLVRLQQTQDALVLKRRLSKRYLMEHWLIAAVLEVIGNGADAASSSFAMNRTLLLDDWRRLYLARIYHELEMYPMAQEQLEKVQSLSDIRYLERIDAVEIFIYYNLTQKASELMESERNKVQDRPLIFQLPVMYSWMLVQIALGQTDTVQAWIASLEQPPADLFAQEYFMGVRFQHYDLALEGARSYQAQEPGLVANEYLAQALLLTQNYEEALGLVAQLYQDNPADWLDSYGQVLYETHKIDLWHQLWLQELKKPELTSQRVKEIAFVLLEKGFKTDAEHVFMELSTQEGPQGSSLEQLLFLWGARPTAAQLDWLTQQTDNASNDNKVYWYQKLIQVGQGQRLVQYIAEHQPLTNLALEDLYLGYLQSQSNRKPFYEALAQAIKNEDGQIRLKKLAAMAAGQPLAEEAFQKLSAILPNDKESIAQLGIRAYGQGRYGVAQTYFEDAMNRGLVDPQVYFIYGDLLERKRIPKASNYYQEALALIRVSGRKDRASQLIQAQIFWKLKETTKTVEIYRNLIRTYPLEISLKSDLANYLIELGRIDEAEELIGVH